MISLKARQKEHDKQKLSKTEFSYIYVDRKEQRKQTYRKFIKEKR